MLRALFKKNQFLFKYSVALTRIHHFALQTSLKIAGPICALNGVLYRMITSIKSSCNSCNVFPMKNLLLPMNGSRGSKVFKPFIALSIICTYKMYLMKPNTSNETTKTTTIILCWSITIQLYLNTSCSTNVVKNWFGTPIYSSPGWLKSNFF